VKLSARNQLPGDVVAVTPGATTTHVRIALAGGAVVTASITNEAAQELGLRDGMRVFAVIKASDVMVGVD
jgi:molybdopterin-binding protein